MRTAIVGATGAVGLELALVLAQREFPAGEVRLMASSRSAGKTLQVMGRDVVLENLDEADPSGIDFDPATGILLVADDVSGGGWTHIYAVSPTGLVYAVDVPLF